MCLAGLLSCKPQVHSEDQSYCRPRTMNGFIILMVLAATFAVSQAAWDKISLYPICFEATGDQPGRFLYYGNTKLVNALRLVWLSGEVRCVSDIAYNSKWGCYRHPTLYGYNLNVVITDFNDHIIFPKPEYIKYTAGVWYWLPGVDEKHSNELVFTDFATPFYLRKGGELKIWYGEDLKNSNDKDNQGRVCVDVYARFV